MRTWWLSLLAAASMQLPIIGQDAAITPAMKADFEKRVRTALEQADPVGWHALTHWGGVSPAGRKEAQDSEFLLRPWEAMRAGRGNLKIGFAPPDPSLTRDQVVNGTRYRPNLPVVLQAELDFQQPPVGNVAEGPSMIGLGVFKGKVYGVAAIDEKLLWNGPPDHQMIVRMRIKDASDDFACTIDISFNASGVALTEQATITHKKTATKSGSMTTTQGGSATFQGQRIDRIVAHSFRGTATLHGEITTDPERLDRKIVPIPAQPVGNGATEVVLWSSPAAGK